MGSAGRIEAEALVVQPLNQLLIISVDALGSCTSNVHIRIGWVTRPRVKETDNV